MIVFAVIGFISTAFLVCLAVSTGILEGAVWRLTAHRLGLIAYRESRRREMRRNAKEAAERELYT